MSKEKCVLKTIGSARWGGWVWKFPLCFCRSLSLLLCWVRHLPVTTTKQGTISHSNSNHIQTHNNIHYKYKCSLYTLFIPFFFFPSTSNPLNHYHLFYFHMSTFFFPTLNPFSLHHSLSTSIPKLWFFFPV